MTKQKYPKTKIFAFLITVSLIAISAALMTVRRTGSSIPDDLSGCIIVFYKDGCPDCQATMKQIRNAMKNTKDVFFLNSQSDDGKRIREQYPIQEVPSAIYIHKTDSSYTMYVLYKKTEDGPVTDFDAINRIIEIKNSMR